MVSVDVKHHVYLLTTRFDLELNIKKPTFSLKNANVNKRRSFDGQLSLELNVSDGSLWTTLEAVNQVAFQTIPRSKHTKRYVTEWAGLSLSLRHVNTCYTLIT